MKCAECMTYIDDFFDGVLDRQAVQNIEDHLAGCQICRDAFAGEKHLRHMLKSMPAPLPSPDFAGQVLAGAVAQSRGRSRFRKAVSMAGALAAGVVVWLMLSLTGGPMHPGPENKIASVPMILALQQATTIRMVVNAPYDMLQSTVTVLVPAHLEIVGFPGESEISWNTDLLKGKNLLELPVVAKKIGESTLVTQIDYQNKRKILTLTTQIENIQQSSLNEKGIA